MSEQSTFENTVGVDQGALTAGSVFASIAQPKARYLVATHVLCMHEGAVYQLWRDVYSEYGEYRKVPEYNPEGAYKIA